MTRKEDFDPTEWERVAEGPALAGLIVMAAHGGERLREAEALVNAYADAAKEHAGDDLLGEIVGRTPKLEMRELGGRKRLRERGIGRLREAVATLEAKASRDEVEAYKRFALSVAERVAEAGRSGGFLGIGGKRVSDAERAALAEIAVALGTEPPAAASTA